MKEKAANRIQNAEIRRKIGILLNSDFCVLNSGFS
jgi:hypothetical protein